MSQVVVIAAGGTGGHIYPGLAIAEALKKTQADIEIHFFGTERGLESKIIPQAGYPLHKIPVGKLNPSAGLKEMLKTVVRLPLAFYRSYRLLKVLKPRFLLGVGGYATGPALLIGSLMGHKSYIWEPNAMPGMANRILSRFVDEAFVVFEEAKKLLSSSKVTQAGMPLRSSIEKVRTMSRPDDKKFHVFAFGGSQGARGINNTLCELLTSRPEVLNDVEVIHQTGRLDFERIKSSYQQKNLGEGSPVQVLEYINDMEEKYAWADLIICRSGTGTLSELAAAGKASLLIPFPFAADNHQQKNAEVLVRADAAEMILQKDLSAEVLRERIERLKNDPARRQNFEKNVRQFYQPEAAEKLAQMLLEKSK